jgi:aspartate-semialdehyde dehydrogenase
MSSDLKSAVTRPDAAHGGQYRVAIVGAGTLKGKEIAEVLGERNFPSLEIKLLDDDESLGQLETVGEEISFIQSARAEQFEHVDFTFFASDAECTRQTSAAARKVGSAIVDLSSALEDEPDAIIRCPWVERQLGQTVAPQLQPGPVVVAHPAAIVLGLLLLRVQKAGCVRRAVATVFEPASEHGQKGVDELHEQTVNLLSFQQLPKKVFDAQIAFNMLASYGEQSLPPLGAIEQRILKHYRQIVGENALLPSVLLVQAPIFHGHAFAIHLEFKEMPDLKAVGNALAGDHVKVAQLAIDTPNNDAPNNVNAAGQGDILVSLACDPSLPDGLWLWAAADNLRVSAATAVQCAESMVASRPKGQIQ